MLMRLSTCLMEVMTDFKESDRTTGKVRYLLGWIAEAYKELAFFGGYNPIG